MNSLPVVYRVEQVAAEGVVAWRRKVVGRKVGRCEGWQKAMYRTRGGKQKQLQIVQLRRLIDGYFRLVKTNGKEMA